MKPRGFTLMEALVCIMVIALLAAVCYPALIATRLRLTTVSATSRLHQLGVGLQVYRMQWEGVDVFTNHRSYYQLGLPVLLPFDGLPGIDSRMWASPCSNPPDEILCLSAMLPGACGFIRYVAGLYDPELIDREPHVGNGNRIEYLDYIYKYKYNIVLLIEPHCNPQGTNMMSPLIEKQGIAYLLSGQLVTTRRGGDASHLKWYSEPYDD